MDSTLGRVDLQELLLLIDAAYSDAVQKPAAFSSHLIVRLSGNSDSGYGIFFSEAKLVRLFTYRSISLPTIFHIRTRRVEMLEARKMLSRYISAYRYLSRSVSSDAAATTSSLQRNDTSYHSYTVQDLMNAKVHMGHRKQLWNPHMARYLLGHRNGMHVIDLDKTAPLLRRALIAVAGMAEYDCTFLWLGPRDAQKGKIVEKQAQKAGAFTIGRARWIGGTLTNPIKSNQAQRFNYRIPDCMFVIDVNRHMPALREANTCGIPTVGIVDSDCDPRLLTYPIPGNDDSALSIYLYCSLMKHAILEGRRRGRMLNRPSVTVTSAEDGHGGRARSSRRQR